MDLREAASDYQTAKMILRTERIEPDERAYRLSSYLFWFEQAVVQAYENRTPMKEIYEQGYTYPVQVYAILDKYEIPRR